MIFKTQAMEEFARARISSYTRFGWSKTTFSNTDIVLDYLRHFNVHSFQLSSSFQARDYTILEWFGYNESDEKVIKPNEAIRTLEDRIYRLLLIDGFSRHYSPEIAQYYEEYDIIPILLPLHLTHWI